ncbi:MAG: hypothetical protein ACHQYQ_05605 [Bacteriovoracales bacterium]
MKSIVIISLVSLAIGFSISKIFFSSKEIRSGRDVASAPTKINLIKPEKVELKGEIKRSPEALHITKSILNASSFFQKNQVERDIATDEVRQQIENNPEESYSAIKTLFKNGTLDTDPILKGSLLVEAAFIKGKKEEVREMALEAIYAENIPKEKHLNELPTENDINKEYSDDPKILGMAQYYDAFMATTRGNEGQLFDKSIEIIENQPNIKVQRLIAKKFLENFPKIGPEFWETLKRKDIVLIPPGGKITIGGITYQ